MRGFAADRAGSTAIEYALIAALIGLVIVTSLTSMGTKLSTFFSAVSTNLR